MRSIAWYEIEENYNLCGASAAEKSRISPALLLVATCAEFASCGMTIGKISMRTIFSGTILEYSFLAMVFIEKYQFP